MQRGTLVGAHVDPVKDLRSVPQMRPPTPRPVSPVVGSRPHPSTIQLSLFGFCLLARSFSYTLRTCFCREPPRSVSMRDSTAGVCAFLVTALREASDAHREADLRFRADPRLPRERSGVPLGILYCSSCWWVGTPTVRWQWRPGPPNGWRRTSRVSPALSCTNGYARPVPDRRKRPAAGTGSHLTVVGTRRPVWRCGTGEGDAVRRSPRQWRGHTTHRSLLPDRSAGGLLW